MAEALAAISAHALGEALPTGFSRGIDRGRRRIIALLHLEADPHERGAVKNTDGREDQRKVVGHLAHDPVVENDAVDQANRAEKRVEAAQQGLGHHVVDKAAEDRLADDGGEFEGSPEDGKTQHRHHHLVLEGGEQIRAESSIARPLVQAHAEGVVSPAEAVQPARDMRGHRDTDHAKGGDRRGGHEEGDAAAPLAAMTVGLVADDRAQHEGNSTRKGAHEDAEPEIRNLQATQIPTRDADDRAVPHGPGKIAKEQPEKQHHQPAGGVGQRADFPDLALAGRGGRGGGDFFGGRGGVHSKKRETENPSPARGTD